MAHWESLASQWEAMYEALHKLHILKHLVDSVCLCSQITLVKSNVQADFAVRYYFYM